MAEMSALGRTRELGVSEGPIRLSIPESSNLNIQVRIEMFHSIFSTSERILHYCQLSNFDLERVELRAGKTQRAKNVGRVLSTERCLIFSSPDFGERGLEKALSAQRRSQKSEKHSLDSTWGAKKGRIPRDVAWDVRISAFATSVRIPHI